jgi:hypothetical protein
MPMPDSPEEGAARPLDIRQQLDQHDIAIEPAQTLFEATPSNVFSTRKVRFTVEISHQPITRETTWDRLSTMLAEYLGPKKAKLLGIDGINGFQCGPTEEELRWFYHSLTDDNDELISLTDTHLPPGGLR